MRLLVASLLVLASMGCRAQTYLLPQQPIPADTMITLSRSQCFGSCPDYKVSVTGDGTVTFEGREFVKTKGVAKGSITSDAVRQLIAAFETATFFSLRDAYETAKDGCPEKWTDNPTVLTSLRLNGKTKVISHYHGCKDSIGNSYPNGLTELENRIDELSGTRQWIK
jgi:hypothetical protein